MDKEVRKYCEDVLLSIEAIDSHLKGILSFTGYANDLKTIDAVERRLGIIGEAIFKANKMDAGLVISNKKKIIGLRHILVHDYDLINDSSIWLICTDNLPLLKTEVQNILNEQA